MAIGPISYNNYATLLNYTFAPKRAQENTFGGMLANMGRTDPSLDVGLLQYGLNSSALYSEVESLQNSMLNTFDDQKELNRTELDLMKAVAPLNSNNLDSTFTAGATAESTDPDVVGAEASGNAAAGTYEVEVGQLAQAQQVEGDALTADAASTITTSGGFGQLEFNVGGETQLVTFELTGGETSEEALNVVADAINERDFGVNASVQVDTDTNEARLVLEGENSGATNTFSVTDTVGNAAAVTGIDDPANVTQNAADAEFSVNGLDFTSPTNQVELGDSGLTLDLQGTTGAEPVTVTVEQAANTDLEQNVRDFVAQYNETLAALKDNSFNLAQQSAADLQYYTSMNAGELRDIGIEVQAGGQLRINEESFNEALNERPGDIEQAFNSRGYAALVEKEAEQTIQQSLDTPVSTGFGNTFNVFAGGFTVNQMIASNIGMFFGAFGNY